MRCLGSSEVLNHSGKASLSRWRVDCSKLSWSTENGTKPAFPFKRSKSSVTVNLGVEMFEGAGLRLRVEGEGDLAVGVEGGECDLK